MKDCTDLYVLSTIACKIAECVTEEELALLAIKFTTLGDMLSVIVTRQAVCGKETP